MINRKECRKKFRGLFQNFPQNAWRDCEKYQKLSVKIYGLCAEIRKRDLRNTTYESQTLYRDLTIPG
jgi:hypothetical protein